MKLIFNKNKDKEEYSSQKIINRQKLSQQNLIFLAGAIIIVVILVLVVVSNLSFLVEKINAGVGISSDNGIKRPEFFDLEGFEKIKAKISAPSLVAPSPVPVSTSTRN